MVVTHIKIRWLLLVSICSLLLGCFHKPYNNFQKDKSALRQTAGGAVLGTGVGLITNATLVGMGVGAAAGGAIGLYKNSQKGLIAELQKHDIQYVEYGDRMSVIVPIDKYFLFNSSKFNESQYVGLNTLIKLLQSYPNSVIYVAAFTDNVGKTATKIKLSQAQAETMLTFIWANGFKAQQLQAQGFGDYFPISDNSSVHGSAQNRRLEIQWFKKGAGCKVSPLRTRYATK